MKDEVGVSQVGKKEKESVVVSKRTSQEKKRASTPSPPESGDTVVVQQMDLCSVVENRHKATQRWVNYMINHFGIIPDEIVVSRESYLLIFAYLFAYGTLAAGNWLDLDFFISYDPRYKADDAMFYDWCTGMEISYLGAGSDIIQFTEKDIIKKKI